MVKAILLSLIVYHGILLILIELMENGSVSIRKK